MINYNFDFNDVERTRKFLAGISNGINKASKNAISKTTSLLKTESVKKIQEKYDVSTSNLLRKEQFNATLKHKDSGNMKLAYINVKGYKLPLYKYNGTSPKYPTKDTSSEKKRVLTGNGWRMVYPGKNASAHQLKNTSPKRLEDTFVATMKSGHIGIFKRTYGVTSTGGEEIQELMGAAVPQMLGNEQVRENLSKTASKSFSEQLEYETIKILNGWGR